MTRKRIHTPESIAARAALYANRSQFAKRDRRTYDRARYHGLLDGLFPLSEPEATPWTYWTWERIAEVSKQYPTRSAMRAGPHQHALNVAKQQGWEDALPPKTCPRPQGGGTSDADLFYLWRASLDGAPLLHEGLPVYKIGAASQRVGIEKRLSNIRCCSGLQGTLLLASNVPPKTAYDLEAWALTLGQDPKLHKFYGSTEFRALTDAEVGQIVSRAWLTAAGVASAQQHSSENP